MTAPGESPRWKTRPNWKANCAAANANAAAKRYNSREKIKTSHVLEVWDREPVCVDCGNGQGLDHIVPLRAGGRNHPSNLRNLCPPCNSRRGRWSVALDRRILLAIIAAMKVSE